MLLTQPVTGMLLGTPIDLPGAEAEPAQNCTGCGPDDDARELSLLLGARSPQNSGGEGTGGCGRHLQRRREGHSLRAQRIPVPGVTAGVQRSRVRAQCPLASSGGHSLGSCPRRPALSLGLTQSCCHPPPTHTHTLRQQGRERAGRELCGGEKTFVSRAHTPPLGENASAPRLSGPNRGIWREPLPRKGRDGEPTSGAGEDSGPRLGQGLRAAPGWAPPQPPPRRHPAALPGSRKPPAAPRARVGSAGQGRPLVPSAARCRPSVPGELSRTEPFS